jgi:hypothetical protein
MMEESMVVSNTAGVLPGLHEKYATGHTFSNSGQEVRMRLKKSTVHHERCRAIAALLWSIHPELTIAEMARRDEIIKFGCEGEEYNVRTIGRWLSSLKDYKRPGRPKKRQLASL